MRIGRAYDNDVVLDDPHVAAHHLQLSQQDDGSWLAEDLGSLNGLYLRRQRVAAARLDFGDEALRIGNTWLRPRDTAQTVRPELPLRSNAGWRAWTLALGLVAVLGGLSVLDDWLAQTDRPRWGHYCTSALTLIAMVLLWSGAWAVVSRVFFGAAAFRRQLLIGCCTVLAVALCRRAADVLSYALSWGGFAGGTYIAICLIVAGACLAHLMAVTPRWAGQKAAVVFGLALAAIAWQTVSRSDMREMLGPNTVVSRLQPPALRLVPPQTVDAFLRTSAGLEDSLDQARKKEPPPGSGGEEEDDD